jgi:hypothetical protein
MQVGGESYLRYLANAIPQYGSRYSLIRSGLTFIGDWTFYAHRVQYSSATVLLREITEKLPLGGSIQLALRVLVFLLVIGLYAWAILRLMRSHQRTNRRTALLLLLSAGVLWVSAVVSKGWTSHHFVYAQVPLLMLLAYAFAQHDQGYLRLGSALGGLTFLSLIAIWLLPIRPEASREIRVAFQTALALADSESVINCSSWGCYYTYSLLNERNIPVVFADNAEMTQRLQDYARVQHKRIIHLCMACDLSAVKDLYSQSAVAQVDGDTINWSIFRVVAAPAF